jgi:hypothetical protein
MRNVETQYFFDAAGPRDKYPGPVLRGLKKGLKDIYGRRGMIRIIVRCIRRKSRPAEKRPSTVMTRETFQYLRLFNS